MGSVPYFHFHFPEPLRQHSSATDPLQLVDHQAGHIEADIRRVIRENTTPRHVPARIVAVDDIPRTRSGKIVELAVRDVVHGEPVRNIEALANPEALASYKNRAELA